ncbi:MAG: glycosyltransferase family 10 [Candidatus Pedobacter colombiensis]|uniref:Glycosyltransferase family 10 n=1 Tax=Candidatus Pedobacter colombiensis TaxID=3121371 RepID=A0AAJ5W6Y6_9SPHI|nr:glycosyltransferase family 10 [Pedobacter sp.]WEK19177.1 MAG: glycosyltransferase family 10 [Pedobacter sp.]
MKLKSLLTRLGLSKPILDYTYLPDESHIEVLNCWTTEAERLWHYQYVKHHFAKNLSQQNSLLISSVFGPKQAIKLSKSYIKLFYTGENVMRYRDYKDHCNNMVDLMIGFDYLDHERYQRFPYWLEPFFSPKTDSKMIRQTVSNFVNKDICREENKKFTSLVSSHDDGKIRTILFNSLNKIDRVTSAGKLLNNSQALNKDFGDNKEQFIGHYKFNICPENSNRKGYVTEKVFEAIRSNTIPIYWGSNNNPEPDVLNKDAILFYDGPDSLNRLNKQVAELHHNPKLYQEFLNQPKFQPNAAEYIIHIFDSLNTKVQKILAQKN